MKTNKRKKLKKKNPNQIGDAHVFNHSYKIVGFKISDTYDEQIIIRFYTAEKISGRNHFDVVLKENIFNKFIMEARGIVY